MGNDDVIEIREKLAELGAKIDGVNNTVAESNKAIVKLTDAITDLRVIQSRVGEQDKKISVLFDKFDSLSKAVENKYDDLNRRLDKFMAKVTFSLIGGGITVVGAIIVAITTR